MTIEHRAAPSAGPLELCLRPGPQGALALVDVDAADHQPAPRTPRPSERVLEVLGAAGEAMTRRAIRDACRMRSTSVGDALAELVADGAVIETERGIWSRADVSVWGVPGIFLGVAGHGKRKHRLGPAHK